MDDRIQHGGVIGFKKTMKTLKEFSKTCFRTFLKHSKVSYLSKGTYGVALLLKIDNPSASPYIDIQGKPVTVLIVKMGLVSNQKARAKHNDVQPIKQSDFEEEHKVQESIFRKSLETYDSAICPAIVFIDTLTWDELRTSYPKLSEHMKAESNILYSIIGMETFPNVDTLYNYEATPALKNVSFHLLLRLGAIGYAHGDPSLSNIILEKKSKRPYLIDFGNPVKLSSTDTDFMKSQLSKVTDLKRVLTIMMKGFPEEYPEMDNWDWVRKMNKAPELPKTTFSKFKDKNWSKVL